MKKFYLVVNDGQYVTFWTGLGTCVAGNAHVTIDGGMKRGRFSKASLDVLFPLGNVLMAFFV